MMLAEMSGPVAATTVSKRFGRYKDEDEHAVRAPEVMSDEENERITEAWGRCAGLFPHHHYAKENYSSCLWEIRGLEYTSEDVEKFAELIMFQKSPGFDNLGLFLSALINNCKDTDFIIHTRHLPEELELLGYKNIKNITVEGNCGLGLGFRMEGGRIAVEGSTGDSPGAAMAGGDIVVKGDAGRRAGESMSGGVITVEGNVGE